MKKVILNICVSLFVLSAVAQTPFPNGIALRNAQQRLSADSIPVMGANGKINSYISVQDLISNDSSTGLEALDEGNGIGWRLIGRNPANFGNIGLNAIDFSTSDAASSTRGATGQRSFALGDRVTASTFGSVSMGALIDNNAFTSLLTGINQQSSGGYNLFVQGIGHIVRGNNVAVFGQAANIVNNNILTFNDGNKPLFVIGNGTVQDNDVDFTVLTRSNAFEVTMDGRILAPSTTIADIDSEVTGKQLTTREWVEAQGFGSGGTGIGAIIDATDTPAAYTGQTGKVLSVNQLEDAFEFIRVAKLDENSPLDIVIWAGTQAQFDTQFPSGAPSNYLSIITDSVVQAIELTDTLSTGIAAGQIPQADGNGGIIWVNPTSASESFARVADYAALSALTGMVNDNLAYVTGEDIRGFFKYNNALSATNNGGTIIDGWVRQFNGDIIAHWFKGADNDANMVNRALAAADSIPVLLTKNITVNRPILMDSNQTFNFENVTITVPVTISEGDPFVYWNGHAVIKNRNGAGLGADDLTPHQNPGGDWGGTGLGGETNITVIGGTIVGTGHVQYMYNGVQFDNVSNSRIENIKFIDVLTRTGRPQGNVDLRDSNNIYVKNIHSTGTEKSGIWANDCVDLHIDGGFITLSGDSGIAGETNERPIIENITVDNCGLLPAPLGASNITMDMRNGKFINNTVLNASGTTNGYGLTLGHPTPFDAWNTVVSGNHFEGNAVNGIRLQGALTKGITIEGNTFINNGNGSVDSGAGGINFNAVTSSIATNNYFQNNRHGVITSNGATDITIANNIIEDSNQFGINLASPNNIVKNNSLKGNLVVHIYDGSTGNVQWGNTHSDGADYGDDIQKFLTVKGQLPLAASLWSNSLAKITSSSPEVNNVTEGSHAGIAMGTDGRSAPYGMSVSTRRNTSRSDFDLLFKAHKGTQAGVEVFKIRDNGAAVFFNGTTASITNPTVGSLLFNSANSSRPTIYDGTSWQPLAYVGENSASFELYTESGTIAGGNGKASIGNADATGIGGFTGQGILYQQSDVFNPGDNSVSILTDTFNVIGNKNGNSVFLNIDAPTGGATLNAPQINLQGNSLNISSTNIILPNLASAPTEFNQLVIDENGAVSSAPLSSGSGAIDVAYDNTASGLTATNVQEAIDEVATISGSSTFEELINQDFKELVQFNKEFMMPSRAVNNYNSSSNGVIGRYRNNIILAGANADFSYPSNLNFRTTNIAGNIATQRGQPINVQSDFDFHHIRGFFKTETVSDERFFIGLSSMYGGGADDPTNVEPDTLINSIGLCKLSTSNNLHIIHNDPTGTATTIDLGASYPANDVTLYYYKIEIYGTINTSVTVRVTRITRITGDELVSTSLLTTDLPDTFFVYPALWVTNNATAGFANIKDRGVINYTKTF